MQSCEKPVVLSGTWASSCLEAVTFALRLYEKKDEGGRTKKVVNKVGLVG